MSAPKRARGVCRITPPRRVLRLPARGSVGEQACRGRARSCAVTTATAIRPRCSRRPTAARRCSRCMPSITRSRGCARAVTQPMLGQIRLQWWREVIAAAYAGAPARRHEIVQPLVAAIGEFGLSRAPFDRIIDTRERDLDDAPPADLAALVDYAEGTSSALIDSRAGGARGGRACDGGGGARGRHRLRAGRSVAGDAVSCRRRTLLHPAGGRERGSGSIRQPMHGVAIRAALRAAAAELAETAATHLAAARRNAPAKSSGGRTPALLPAVIADRFLRAPETGRVQPVRARTGRAGPAAKLAPRRGRAARPVLRDQRPLKSGRRRSA